MIFFLPGIVSFACFLLFDVAKAKSGRNVSVLFFTGALLLSASTAGLLYPHIGDMRPLWRAACGILAAAWLVALLYVLFAALPAADIYAGTGKLQVCSAGPYAVCRHPGGWCFLFLYWCLWLYAPATRLLIAAILYPTLNFVYIWLQDRYLFPKYIKGYEAYKREVPFLLPTRSSIRRGLGK